MKTSTADCLGAIAFAGLLLLPLWLPYAPMLVQVPMVILVTLVGLFLAASALRYRWHLSQNPGQFLGYYLRLTAVAIVIIVAFLLLVLGIGRLFFT